MNSCNNINKNNVMNFSTRLSTLNQFESNADLMRFPFDHIYACHSSTTRRTLLPFDKQVEEASRLLVAEKEHTYLNFKKIHEHLNTFELQNKHLNDLLIYHIELVQQQNEALTKKNKLIQILTLENGALKEKLVELGIRMAFEFQSDPHTATYQHDATSTVTSANINKKAKVVKELFPAEASDRNKKLQKIIEKARVSAKALIDKHNRERTIKLIAPTHEMTDDDKRQSRLKKSNSKGMSESQTKPPQHTKANRTPPVRTNAGMQKNKRKARKSIESSTEQDVKMTEIATTSANAYQAPSTAKKKIFKSAGSAPERPSTVSSARITNDPYHLGEDDLRENSPIPKLVSRRKAAALSSEAVRRKCSFEDIPKDVNVEDDINTSVDKSAPTIVELPAERYERVILAMNPVDGSHERDAKSPSRVMGNLPTTSRNRKRANSTNMVGTPKKIPRRSRVSFRPLAPAIPGITINESFPTLIGEPSNDWCISLASGEDTEMFDSDLFSVDSVEVPQWRINDYKPYFNCICPEFVDDKTFKKRHTKRENEERRQQRWHMRRIREQRHMERLRQRHKDSWSNMPVSTPSVYTLWPRPQRDMHELHITITLPVGALGEDVPNLQHAEFMLPWIRRSKASKRAKRSKTLH